MSRRRKPAAPKLEAPNLTISILLRPDGAVEIDPQYNKPAIDHLDRLYHAARREDYDPHWNDDHKIAFFMADMVESVLAQYGPSIDQEEVDASVAPVPHISEAPVLDVFDLNQMAAARSKRPN